MFDIGFLELALIFVIGLLVLGPERLPVAVRKVMRVIRTIKSTANSLSEELNQELKVNELHQDLKKAELMGMNNLSEDLQASVESLQQAAASVTRPYAKGTESMSESVNGSVNDIVTDTVSGLQQSFDIEIDPASSRPSDKQAESSRKHSEL